MNSSISSERLHELLATSNELTNSLFRDDPDQSFKRIVTVVQGFFDAQYCSLFLPLESEPDTIQLVAQYPADVEPGANWGVRIRAEDNWAKSRTGTLATRRTPEALSGEELGFPPGLIGGVNTGILSLPLVDKKERLLGLVLAEKIRPNRSRQPEDQFSDADVGCAKILGNSLALFLDNLRIRYALTSIIRTIQATTSLDLVFKTVVEAAVRLTGARSGCLAVPRSQDQRLEIRAVVPSDYLPLGVPSDPRLYDQLVAGSIVGPRPVGYPLDQTAGHVNEITIPLSTDAEAFGALHLESDYTGAFDDRDVDILSRLSDYACIAIQTRRRDERVTAAYSRVSQSIPRKEILLERALDGLNSSLGFDSAVVFELDKPSMGALVVSALVGSRISVDAAYRLRYPLDGPSLVSEALRTEKPIFCANPQDDSNVTSEGIAAFGLREPVIVLPLIVETIKVGVLATWRTKEHYAHEEDMQYLLPFAQLIAVFLRLASAERFALARLEDLNDVFRDVQSEDSDRSPIHHVLKATVNAGFDCARLYTYVRQSAEQQHGSFIGLESIHLGSATQEKGKVDRAFIGMQIDCEPTSPYAGELEKNYGIDRKARVYDPRKTGVDQHHASLGKPEELEWAAAPLVMDGELLGQIAADNRYSRRPIDASQQFALTVVGGLASVILHHDRVRRELEQRARDKGVAEGMELSSRLLATSFGHEVKNVTQTIGVQLSSLADYGKQAFASGEWSSVLRESIEYIRSMSKASTAVLEIGLDTNSSTRNRSLRWLVKKAVEIVGPYAAVNYVTIKLGPGGNVVAPVAAEQLIAMFNQFIRNAIDHMSGESKRITVSFKTESNHVTVTFDDTGTGFSAEALERWHEPGFSTSGAGHSGLGLWMAQTIMASGGGYVSPENRTDPLTNAVTGARVQLYIPRKGRSHDGRSSRGMS